MLRTEDRSTEETEILGAFQCAYPDAETEDVRTVFEHGQWWVQWYDTSEDEERTFSVCDASGPGSRGGFDFEEV